MESNDADMKEIAATMDSKRDKYTSVVCNDSSNLARILYQRSGNNIIDDSILVRRYVHLNESEVDKNIDEDQKNILILVDLLHVYWMKTENKDCLKIK